MRNSFYCIVIFFAMVIIAACSKVGTAEGDEPDAIDQSDNVFPVINASKPLANQAYRSGDSIIVEGVVTDEKKMYKGRVQIKNDANGLMVAENYYETHFLPAINFRLAYKTIATASTDFSVLLEFQDHGMNTTTATIKVKVDP